MKIKIAHKLNLREDQNWQINLHSFYNLIQILYNEINILKLLLGDSEHIRTIFKKLNSLHEALDDPQSTCSSLDGLREFRTDIYKSLDSAVEQARELDESKAKLLEESLISLERIIIIVEKRTKEFLNIVTQKHSWIECKVDLLRENLEEVLTVMGIRAKSRYGVTFSKDEQQEKDYFFDLQFPEDRDTINIPALLPDVIRDLVANAKKYSTPGSDITCTLKIDSNQLTLTVRDQGRGIPEKDLPEIVKYGKRGSNVSEEETYGGGFGLTKAYFVTTEHHGEMWIDSVQNEYTEITIKIPVTEQK